MALRLKGRPSNDTWRNSDASYDLRPADRGSRSDALFPCNKVWILRNLVEKSYIRLESIVSKKTMEACHPPFLKAFGNLLLYKTAWTDDPSGCLGDPKSEWAGHRFDVTALDEIQNDSSYQWTDVSRDNRLYQDELSESDDDVYA